MYHFRKNDIVKSLFILLFFVQIAPSPLYAQQKMFEKTKPILSKSIGTTRVYELNKLSHYYITTDKKDSAIFYADLAYKEAKALNDIHGIAVSFCRKAQIAKHFDDDFKASEILGKESLQWYERTPNKEGIDVLYFYLTYSAIAQSKFKEAIFYSEKAYQLAKQTGDQTQILVALSWMGNIYRQTGDYEKFFLLAQQLHDLALKANNKIWVSYSLYFMAQLYAQIEDYPSALNYFRQVAQMDDSEIRNDRIVADNDIWFNMEFAEVFSHLGQFDSAWHYYKTHKPANDKPVYLRVYWVSTGECYFLQKEYLHALRNFELGLTQHRKLNDRNEVMRTVLNIGKTHLALWNNEQAFKFGTEGLALALETGAKQYIRDGYQILATVYDRLHQPDSANFYFRHYVSMKESILDDQARGRLAVFRQEQQIALMQKEKEIQRVRLQKESLLKKVLISGIGLLMLFGCILWRNITLKRKSEKRELQHTIALQAAEGERLQASFQQRTLELQMQALRAQMNPHFIFNSLNSINHFVLKNNRQDASAYLIKFSRLVRQILQNSTSPLIPLENELEALQLYLDLEALRFDHMFTYKITIDEIVDVTVVQVPPLILQPYIENAIWHGLMHKKEKGLLEISISQEEDLLYCKIADDGIGRKRAAEIKAKSSNTYKSLGIGITADRISLLHGDNQQVQENITIKDLITSDGYADGTEVTIKLPVRYDQNYPDRR